MGKPATITCSAPPLAEVVYGAQFRPLPFSVATAGRLADRFSRDFPIVEEAAALPTNLEAPPGTSQQRTMLQHGLAAGLAAVAAGPMLQVGVPRSRLMLLNAEKSSLLQIQPNRFHHNWRKVGAGAYPQFDELMPAFLARWREFRDHIVALLGQGPRPIQYELTYVNHIEAGPLWTPNAPPTRIFPWFTPPLLAAGQALTLETGIHQVLPKLRGRFHMVTRTARRVADGHHVLVAEFTVRGAPVRPLDDSDLEVWMTDAHEQILTAFVDMTGPEAHAIWGLKK